VLDTDDIKPRCLHRQSIISNQVKEAALAAGTASYHLVGNRDIEHLVSRGSGLVCWFVGWVGGWVVVS
jgi:hypothetical protein